jgi:nucleoside-diphosphate-sugar epimerase
MAEKAVVTGSTGYIGSHLVPALKSAGFEVIEMGRDFWPVECDRIYHLACPSSSAAINNNTIEVMDAILDKTREAIEICPTALFINSSSMGATEPNDPDPQGAYNVAKLCMEVYIKHKNIKYINYRIPSVYNPAIRNDGLLKRCFEGKGAYPPKNPDKIYFIGHMDDVIDALVNLTPMPVEFLSLGEIYEQFSTWRSGLCRPASNQGSV